MPKVSKCAQPGCNRKTSKVFCSYGCEVAPEPTVTDALYQVYKANPGRFAELKAALQPR